MSESLVIMMESRFNLQLSVASHPGFSKVFSHHRLGLQGFRNQHVESARVRGYFSITLRVVTNPQLLFLFSLALVWRMRAKLQ